jgi:hypothetical protein
MEAVQFGDLPLRDYSALRASPFGVALAGDQRRCATLSNPACFM